MRTITIALLTALLTFSSAGRISAGEFSPEAFGILGGQLEKTTKAIDRLSDSVSKLNDHIKSLEKKIEGLEKRVASTSASPPEIKGTYESVTAGVPVAPAISSQVIYSQQAPSYSYTAPSYSYAAPSYGYAAPSYSAPSYSAPASGCVGGQCFRGR